MVILDRVRRTIRDHQLISPGTRVVAAVSGGSDSVGLVHLLHRLHAAGEVVLAGIAHFNHQLRPSADADEQFVARIASALSQPLFADREHVMVRARRERRSVEDAARASRHEFFERARVHFDADRVAVGHTRDDQAETFLLRLVRGAGPRGLAAMYPRNAHIVRPLLDCRRQELRRWLADQGIAFIEDESNSDVSIPRNRVRAELLPLLASRFNPAIVDVLADEADLARETWQHMERTADEIASRIVKATDDGRVIDVDGLRHVPAALRRLILWRAMTETARKRPVAFEHVAAALRMLDDDSPAVLDAPGQRLERIGARLVLRARPSDAVGRWSPERGNSATRQKDTNLFQYSLSIPGEVRLPEAGCVVSAERGGPHGATDPRAVSGNGALAIVRGDLCRGRLIVRNRRPGDRFRPVGVGGRKKLQDFFVDRKVGRDVRDTVPIIVDDADRIVWVAGYGIDEAFRVTDAAQAVLLLRLKRV